ncbi:hypothetical protein ACIONG_29870, partial [Pseudomonas sp. NPDC087817]
MPSRRERANAIRALSMDAVQKANSGHPPAPIGLSEKAKTKRGRKTKPQA